MGDLGQVADPGALADPHHPLSTELGFTAVVVDVIGLQATAPIVVPCG